MPGKDKCFLPGGDCCQLGVVAATEHDNTVGPDNAGVCVVPRLNVHLHVVGLCVVEGPSAVRPCCLSPRRRQPRSPWPRCMAGAATPGTASIANGMQATRLAFNSVPAAIISDIVSRSPQLVDPLPEYNPAEVTHFGASAKITSDAFSEIV